MPYINYMIPVFVYVRVCICACVGVGVGVCVYTVPFSCRFDFIVTPLIHPRYKKEYFGFSSERPGPVTRSDKVLTGSEWGSYVVGKVSPWLQLDSALEDVRMNSAKVTSSTSKLVQNVHTCFFLFIQYVKCA